jgi:PD-(D/E)XK nuclease superfamily
MISSGSFSRLAVFETCKFRAHLMYELKIAEPDRPLPPGKTEHANDRGSRIHDGAEQFIKAEGPMPKELTSFKPEFEKLQRLYAAGQVSLEGEWGMDHAWEPAPWQSAWLRVKLDALVLMTPVTATVIDYKTGRKFGNEIKHASQGQLYQLAAFLRFPTLEEVTTEFWYTDQDDITPMTFRRDQGLRFRRKWDMRMEAMTTCIEFPPSPNIFNCRYCGYGSWGTGHCTRGVQR